MNVTQVSVWVLHNPEQDSDLSGHFEIHVNGRIRAFIEFTNAGTLGAAFHLDPEILAYSFPVEEYAVGAVLEPYRNQGEKVEILIPHSAVLDALEVGKNCRNGSSDLSFVNLHEVLEFEWRVLDW